MEKQAMEDSKPERNVSAEQNLVEELNLLRSRVMPREAIEQLLEELYFVQETTKDGSLYDLERDLFQKALATVLGKMKELGLEPANLAAYEEAHTLLAKPNIEAERQMFERGNEAEYDVISHKIRRSGVFDILDEEPYHLLHNLATMGYGESSDVMQHELIHSYQFGGSATERVVAGLKELATFFTEGHRAHRILLELHAWMGASRTSKVLSTREHFKTLSSPPYDYLKNKKIYDR